MYKTDLAYIHDAGFGAFARHAGPAIVRMLRQAGIRRGLVVELGCGGGVVAERLTRARYDVLGLDISPAMIRRARRRAPLATFRVASLADAAIPACAAVVAVGEVVTYVPGGLPVLRRFLARAHAALPPGGLLLFDFITSHRGRIYPAKTISGRGWRLVARADVDRARRILTRRMAMIRTVNGRTRRAGETHRVRIYRRDEIVRAVRRAGFSVETSRAIGQRPLIAGDVAVIARRV
jgi:SAM-dependent methyltransferase